MTWLAENWLWMLFGVAFIAMHLFGHGGHGGHGGHDRGGEPSKKKSDEPGAAALCRFVWNATITSSASGGHPSPALPASGKGASRPLPSGLPARKALADNPLASAEGQPVASRPSPSGALRAALNRPSAPEELAG